MEKENRKIEGILIDTRKILTEATIATVDSENFINDLYAKLSCETVDVATRYINGKKVDIWCDDEGLFKENRTALYTISDGKVVEQMVGNLFICSSNQDGESCSLDDKEKAAVMSSFMPLDEECKQIISIAHLEPGKVIKGIPYKELKAREVVNKVVDVQVKNDTFAWDPNGFDETESACSYVRDLLNDDLAFVAHTLDNNCGDPNTKEIKEIKAEARAVTKMKLSDKPNFGIATLDYNAK